MYETVAIDSKTIIVKAESEEKLFEVIDFLNGKDKESDMKSLLEFASSKRKIANGYQFSRDECHAE